MVRPADAERAGAWLNLVQTHRVVQAAVEERLQAETGLSSLELEALMRLAISPDRRLKMIDLAEQLLASKSGITRLVDRLEAGGLIAREVPPDNRRVTHGRVTDAGLRTLERARETFTAALDDAFARHLSDVEVGRLRAILRKLLEGNGAWDEHRCEPAFDGQGVAAHP
jgi:DNA-binding MarR family transcriptional regulator